MGEILNTGEYFASAANAARYVYDKSSGKRYGIRALFLLQRFAEGRHAFTRYEDLLEKSESESTQAASSEIDAMRQILRRYSAEGQEPGRIPPVRKVYKPEAEILLSSINSALDPKQFKKQGRGEADLLLDEPRELCSRLLFSTPASSRVLVMANAGFGKTTLIQRMALALSDCDAPEPDRDADRQFLAAVGDEKPDGLIPCVISLRDHHAGLGSMDQVIVSAVMSLMQNGLGERETVQWLDTVRNRLLLLIDGLDELPGEAVLPFLSELERYLSAHPDTRVIMTTRVSGIDADEAKAALRRLRFRGRTILPLSDHEAKQFCRQWVQETNGSPELLKSLERIQTESHLKYLREFIRKPLELVMLLQYLPHQSYASFNRWDLFYNILWAEITNHIKFESRQSVYDDECKLLSFLAFHMQLCGRQSMTFDELEALVPSIRKLSFYTDLLEVGPDSGGLTAEKIWRHLRHIAQNIGTVETVENTKAVTIPLRSYQEYLTAYACCNLCLVDGELYPNPGKVLEPYINDTGWLGVLGFVIAGMECNEFADLDAFLAALYSGSESIHSLCGLMEVDYFNSRKAAEALCRVKLRKYTLSGEEKKLIEGCMRSRSAFSFRWALSFLHREAFKEGSGLFLEAVSYAYLIEAITKGNHPITLAAELLRSPRAYEREIGAELLVLVSRIVLGEEPVDERVLGAFELSLPGDLPGVLRDLALAAEAPVYIRAMTELLLSRLAEPGAITPLLDQRMLALACRQLFSNEAEVQRQMLHTGTLTPDYIRYLRDLVHTVGLFPYQLGPGNSGAPGPWIQALAAAFYDRSFEDLDLDQIGIAVCRYHITGGADAFIAAWVEDICKGRPSAQVRKDHLTKRENRHFLLVRASIAKDESAYFSKQAGRLNRLRPAELRSADTSPARLFIAGEDARALELSLRLYREGCASHNNLAFLVRFLQYDTEKLLGLSRWAFLDALLWDGVKAHDPYSTMNQALSLLERGDAEEAGKLLQAMSPEGLRDIAEGFWYPVMWKKRREPEGALVCLLAQRAGAASFPEHAEMLKAVTDRAPHWLEVL